MTAGRGFRRPGLLVVAALLAAAGAMPSTALADTPSISPPSAQVPFGGPYVFADSIHMADQPARVELLLQFPGTDAKSVIVATVSGGNANWHAQATYTDHILPNSNLHYQFRVIASDGTATTGPAADSLTVDDRFDWQTVSGPVVRLHWTGGDASFGQRALDIGEKAISNAAQLLGVTETEPIDFFIYPDEKSFYDALGPGLRENVAGTAFSENRTMYAYLLPGQLDQDWARILVTHELTHLVFDTATHNNYHPAPHWLNEGIATYLSEGYAEHWQSTLDLAKSSNTLIPLQGMVATFGAGDARFNLGYAESVSAVDYFVKTYGESKLWALIRSYSEGLSDDDAFRRATGLDLAGFNAAWMQSIGVSVPPSLGPQPGPTSLPAGQGQSGPPPVRPSAPPSSPNGPGVAGALSTGSFVLGLIVIIVVVLLAIRFARRRTPPPPAMWPPPPGYAPPAQSSLPPWDRPDEGPPATQWPPQSPPEPPADWRP